MAAVAVDWRWGAIAARDARADGRFVFAVKTTGIYCRPSCPARRPKSENVLFFERVRDAEQAGFRPCKRCRPWQEAQADDRVAVVEAACRFLECQLGDDRPGVPLAVLARRAGFSASHFHRIFKSVTGLTPKAYALAVRERRLRRLLHSSMEKSVTTAILDAGYGSPAVFYDRSVKLLGMTPMMYRERAPGKVITYGIESCWLGLVLVARAERGICAVLLGDTEEALIGELCDRFSAAEISETDSDGRAMIHQVVSAIERQEHEAKLPFDVQGTIFEHKVWAALRAIPRGETRSYSEIAAAIGAETATRAVARACAANPVAVLTPCHRAVRKDGSLSGYRWGVSRKAALLEREKKR